MQHVLTPVLHLIAEKEIRLKPTEVIIPPEAQQFKVRKSQMIA